MKRALAALIVVALVLVAVGAAALVLIDGSTEPPSDEPAVRDEPVATPSPSGPDPAMPAAPAGLGDFYGQEVDWQACEQDDDQDCATMRVPLDYADPAGEEIELALLRVPAGEPDLRVGSLVVNPGGPGVPGTSYAAGGGSVFGDRLLDHFDVVGFDPRGTGRSATVDCLDDAELDDYLASDPDPDTAAEEAEFVRQSRALGEGCADGSGELASHVTTVEAARDMDVLRAVLAEPRLAYLGASYGTQLGATYAQLFPAHVGRMVLDGAVDLRASARERSLQQAVGFETALRAYVANCVDSGDCFLGEAVDDGVARIQRLFDEVDADPLPGDGERELTEGLAVLGVITPLYNRDFWTILSASLRQALAGNGLALLALADAYAYRGPEGFVNNVVEANYAINCLDDPSAVSLPEARAEIEAFEEATPTFGRIFAYGLTGCGGVQARRTVPEPANASAAGAAPLMVIGTTRDPATPYRWAVAMADQLDSAVLVSRDGDGHTGYQAGNACVDDTVEDYLVDGTVPPGDVDCPAE